ncbi:kinase-like domain-containing protein [Mucidula mucida]|nr:kinase-like domain-containing protein [Mucidula mucida]
MFTWKKPQKFQRRTQWSVNNHHIEFAKKYGLVGAYVRFFRIYNYTLAYGRRLVRFLWKLTGLNRKYYVKRFNSDRCLDADIATTRLVSAHTSIPVPRVLFQFRGWTNRYMIMERMPGVSLDTVFPHLPAIEQARLVGQLHDYMKELRAIPRPDNASSIASVTGGPIFCYRLHHRCDLSGPFRDEAHMNLQLRHGKPVDAYPEPVPTAHALAHPLVLTHNDFASHNIMAMETADGWRITAIIDWECAAWMPSPWEYVKAKNFCSRSLRPYRQQWVDWLPKILDPFDLEAEADIKLGRCPRKHIP